MHGTSNSLPLASREKLVDLLNDRLADAVDLYAQVKHAHWNVKGPNFIALHELFDRLAADLLPHIDDLAERCVQLGGTARGTLSSITKDTSLPEYPATITAGEKHIEALTQAYSIFGDLIRKAIDLADEAKDKDTADLFTAISRDADKALWFIESHAK